MQDSLVAWLFASTAEGLPSPNASTLPEDIHVQDAQHLPAPL